MLKKIKNVSIVLCVLVLVCSAVYAVTYKVPATSSSSAGTTNTTTQNYNVYTPTNYSNSSTVNQGIQQGSIIEIVVDYSGSMSSTIEQVKQIVLNFFPYIPQTTQIGLRLFGQKGGVNPYADINAKYKVIKKGGSMYTIAKEMAQLCLGNTSNGCSNTTLVLPLANYNSAQFYSAMNLYGTGGSTPLTYGLYLAAEKDLAPYKAAATKKIILITDGGENCGGDPCAYVQKLVKTRRDIIIDVILTTQDYTGKFACVANTTGGTLYQNGAFNYNSLSQVLMQSIQSTPSVSIPTQTQQNTYQQTQKEQSYEYIPD